MGHSPQKHQPPFRPVDTLSAPQKPSFGTKAAKRNPPHDSENDSSFLEERSITYLGDFSSLFDGDSFSNSPQYVHHALPLHVGTAY
jgi:hypothetical protein